MIAVGSRNYRYSNDNNDNNGTINRHIDVLQYWDENDDEKLDFEEIFAQLKRYVTLTFKELDKNQDGSILDEAKAGSTTMVFSKKNSLKRPSPKPLTFSIPTKTAQSA